MITLVASSSRNRHLSFPGHFTINYQCINQRPISDNRYAHTNHYLCGVDEWRSWPARPLCFLVSTWLATHPSGLSTFLPAESPTGSTLGVSSRIAGTMPSDPIISSQAHLLKATSDNPLPTAVPPPIAATSGTLGVRHVLCLIGLPERGKPFIARRLQSYLSFFHGADVQLFNINDYSDYPTGVQRVGQLTLRPWPQISL